MSIFRQREDLPPATPQSKRLHAITMIFCFLNMSLCSGVIWVSVPFEELDLGLKIMGIGSFLWGLAGICVVAHLFVKTRNFTLDEPLAPEEN